MAPLTWGTRSSQIRTDRKENVVAGAGGREVGSLCLVGSVVFGKMTVLRVDGGDARTTV